MKKLSACLAILLVMSTHAAIGAVTEFGNPTCIDWVKADSPGNKVWLLGYLSGINVAVAKASKDPLDNMDNADEAFTWMSTYCRNNPTKTVGEAAQVFYTQFKMRSR
jgi:hypothetical protein